MRPERGRPSFILPSARARDAAEGPLAAVGPGSVLGGCLSGRSGSGARHDRNGPGPRRNDGEVRNTRPSVVADFNGGMLDTLGDIGFLLVEMA